LRTKCSINFRCLSIWDSEIMTMTYPVSHERCRTDSLLKSSMRSPILRPDYKGIRFKQLNSFTGSTWDKSSSQYNKEIGSLGEEQLNWFEALLTERKPAVVFIPYPLWLVRATEVKDYRLHSPLLKYCDTIQMVISGHWHKWVDFAHTFRHATLCFCGCSV
jgi:hypothetical protein